MTNININQLVKNTCQQLGFPQDFVDGLDVESVFTTEKQQQDIFTFYSKYSGSVEIVQKRMMSINITFVSHSIGQFIF